MTSTKARMILALMAVLALALGAPLGCGDDDDRAGDADSDTDSDADGDTDSDTDADADFGSCEKSCSAPADCVAADPLETKDANNFECPDGYCVWLGCLDTAECQAAFPAMENIVCDTNQDPPNCTLSCGTAADCTTESANELLDANNWACESSMCVYQGCNDSTECAAATPDLPICSSATAPPVCVPACGAPADCVEDGAASLFDEENFECNGGGCEHLGCLSTNECVDAPLFGAGYICVP